ncbi:hypothetical protein [Candidatus Laterigemmans baculatus]|uniref:hypothetical protein n=1 Tax=Candidatus Laterigemmans baculatus TaxID=2770505 RepID=UPI0013DD10E9|nr:hypothetical protein [Candidatus Laterigemmans baculatus]
MSSDLGEHSKQTTPDQTVTAHPPTLRRWVLFALLTLAVSCGLYVLFGPKPRTAEGVVVATADEAKASGYRQEGEISDSWGVEAAATKLESTRNVMAAHSSASSGGDRMFARTLAIYNLDDDLLMQRVGLEVFERLRDSGKFERVQYLPAGKRLPDGERLPEAFLTLDKREWNESGLPGNRRFEGKILVTASDRFQRSSHSYQNTLSPPQLSYRWRAEIDYTATQLGIETSGARYQAVSRDLAKEITERLTKLLDEKISEHGVPGELPEPFYPEYVEPPAFDFLAELKAEKWIDGPLFMAPVVAVWQTPAVRVPSEVLAIVSRSLAEADWDIPESISEGNYLRATKGNQVFEVFRENDGHYVAGEDAEAPRSMYLVYHRGMGVKELDEAVRRLFEERADESVLVMFQNHWYRHQELVEEYFSDQAPTTAESWLQLARFRKKRDPDAAREALLRANALQWVFHHKSADSSMKKLAKDLGIERLPQDISPEMMEALGFSDLREPGELELTVRENQPAAIGLGEDDEGQRWLLLTPIRRHGVHPERSLRIQMLTLRKGGWSQSDQTGGDLTKHDSRALTHRLGDGDELQVFSDPLDDDRYRLTLQRTAPEQDPETDPVPSANPPAAD